MYKQFSIRFILLFFIFSFYTYSYAQNKINVILFGTYHFNNPGNDAAKTIEKNILTKNNQKGLEQITNSIISKYKPDQIFVENNFNEKNLLNNQFQSYLKNNFDKYTDTIKSERKKRYFKEGETFQLAFRLAKKANNVEIYPIDSLIEMRFDLLQKEVNANPEAKKIFDKKVSDLAKTTNECLEKESLKDVFICLNKQTALDENKGLYISFINKLNTENNYFGSNLISDWYKRNLIMYSNIQNQLKPESKNIFVLVGTGHAAMLKEFFKNDSNFNLIDIGEVL